MTRLAARIRRDASLIRWLAARPEALIGCDCTVLHVGAGTGSYEPVRSGVVAVEPSTVMLSQRAASAVPAVRAVAEALPFQDQAFDADSPS